MADAELVKLYSKRILALAAGMTRAERLAAPQASATKRSPLCGSTVTVDVDMADGRVADLGMDVKACALGQASASVLASAAPGKTPEEVAAARDALQRLLKEGAADLDALGPDFAALEAMTPARDFKNRHASILLAWDAALEAMDGAAARRLRRS